MKLPAVPRDALFRIDPSDFPDLYGTTDWIIVDVRFSLGVEGLEDRLVANVNVAPRVGDDWLIVKLPNGDWSIPGGTRDPNESLMDAARREAREEAGAALSDLAFFGSWRCRSTRPEPFRPHAPHPVFYRVVGIADARIVGPPSNPPDGERILEVAAVPLEEAVSRLRASQRRDLADLYRLAALISGFPS